MAINTETRRRGAQMGAAGTLRPVADGTVGDGDRAQAAWIYPGLTYAAPTLSDSGIARGFFTFLRSLARRVS